MLYQNRSPSLATNPSAIGIALGATSEPHLWSAAPWRRLVFLAACWQAQGNRIVTGSKLPKSKARAGKQRFPRSRTPKARGLAPRWIGAIWESTGRNQASWPTRAVVSDQMHVTG